MSQRSLFLVTRTRERNFGNFKKQQEVLFNIFTVLDGIPSEHGYVIFIGVVNMMARKYMINGGIVTPNACLSWPDFCIPTTLKWSPRFLSWELRCYASLFIYIYILVYKM